ncbi:hypothetical protein PC118_g21192 [Phytophthora cactorum]|uniref:Uncharacterized protein n=1 Tax=Phytophthora cactorum TaxID=29920 RepID=A0A8T1B0S1_9STRA|nr:hypothetical protein PC117_g24227 [Phytophthora cactorum]KAG2962871.1 hypothetical protein PC118_g21192 [Phytophthora cactorum]KAG3058799.1 hypothetical protein PC122_g20566 [Phytophthora cactorum]
MTSAGAGGVAGVGIVRGSSAVDGSAVGTLVDAAPRPGSKDTMNVVKSNLLQELDAVSGFGGRSCMEVAASVGAADFLGLFDFGGSTLSSSSWSEWSPTPSTAFFAPAAPDVESRLVTFILPCRASVTAARDTPREAARLLVHRGGKPVVLRVDVVVPRLVTDVTVDQTRQKNREGAGQNSACGLGWSKGIIARGKSAEPTQMEKDFISYGHVQQQREQLERRTQGS